MEVICKNCLVELEDDMEVCPLCGTPTSDDALMEPKRSATTRVTMGPEEKYLMRRILWQITATLLFSAIAATVIIDLVANKAITWSLYPMTICLMALSYACLFAFWHSKTIYQIIAGAVLSATVLLAVRQFFPAAGWTTGLGIPLLIAVNLISLLLLGVFRVTRQRGFLNLLAYSFVAIAVLCLSIEGIITRYFEGSIHFRWSIIVAACLLPVTAVLVFMFYRGRNNPTIQKLFHT